MPGRQRLEIGHRGDEMALGLVGQFLQHLHGFGEVFGAEEVFAGDVRGGAKAARHEDPAALVILAQPADHVDGLQRQAKFTPQRHQHLLAQADVARVPCKEVGQQVANPPGDLVHVVVHIILILYPRAALHPARHAEGGIADVADNGRLDGGREGVQAIENLGCVRGND